MDRWWFRLAMLGGSVGWPLLVAGCVLMIPKPTRRYAIGVVGLSIVAGAIVAVIVERGLSGIPWHMGFWGTFSLLVILLAGASMVLAGAISLMRRRREGSPRP